MKNPTHIHYTLYRYGLFVLVLALSSCVYQEIEPLVIPVPPVPQPTTQLEATYTVQAPNTINHPFWSSSDYREVSVSDQVTGTVNSQDGILNTSGTYNGLTDYNKGTDPALVIKAAYDDQNLYILAEWQDESLNPAVQSWLYNGPADPNKQDVPDGWTRQNADDQLELAFDMGGGKEDIWKWSFSLSEPMGYALDMVNDNGVAHDGGTTTFIANELDNTNRSGPQLEWSGDQQELTRDPGGFTILDPGFYLLNTASYSGDIANGETAYQTHCAKCHGTEGNGAGYEWDTGVGFKTPGKYARVARSAFSSIVDIGTHPGQTYWNSMTADEKNDVISRIYGWSGIPGYTLRTPDGSCADIKALSNIALARMSNTTNANGYKVLLIRSLKTGNTDDIDFTTTDNFTFNVYLYDGDETNKIGAVSEALIFKPIN